MCRCVYLCLYVCVCVYVCTWAGVCILVYGCVCVFMCVHVCLCVWLCCLYVRICLYICVRVYEFVWVHVLVFLILDCYCVCFATIVGVIKFLLLLRRPPSRRKVWNVTQEILRLRPTSNFVASGYNKATRNCDLFLPQTFILPAYVEWWLVPRHL